MADRRMYRIDDSDMRAAFRHLGRAFKKASDGKVVKRELSKRLRVMAKPLVDERKARVLALPSKGHPGPSMRAAVAKQTRASIRYSGRNVGLSIVQRGRGMPRNFRLAGRAFNRATGWNPTTIGGVKVHQQIRPVGWFDNASKVDRGKIRREMGRAVSDAADKIADDIRRVR